jgi:arsenite/tail-anchored protein-transporting ATPase
VRSQATDVLELLHDPDRCQVVLVTLPETTPVNEVVETAFALEDKVGVQLGPIVVNAVDIGPEPPDPDDASVVSRRR